ncbi:unnamed protein product, partial [Medioppia subpectinata]
MNNSISARTKSLREKFSRNRSYSELSFKDSSASSTPTGEAPPFRYSTRQLSRSHVPMLPEQGRQNSADAIRVTSIPGEQISNSYNILPEEAYCSALDINSGDDGPRFPWQCDAAIQCDLVSAPTLPKPNKSASHSSHTYHNINASLAADQHSGGHKGSGIRFWKSSSILGANNTDDNKKPSVAPPKKRDHKSVLQRAASFDSRGYSRLVQTSTPNSPTFSGGGSQTRLYVPHHIQTLTPSHESSKPGSLEGTPPSLRKERRQSVGTNSAPNSRSGTPTQTPLYNPFNFYQTGITGPFSQPPSRKISSEKRRLCFVRKQANSAPDSFENDSRPQSPEKYEKPSVEVFTFDAMHRLLDISLRATSDSKDMLTKPLLLNIPTAGGKCF